MHTYKKIHTYTHAYIFLLLHTTNRTFLTDKGILLVENLLKEKYSATRSISLLLQSTMHF